MSRSTPLQFAERLTRAFTEGLTLGVQETLSLGVDDLDARLARMGYSPKTLAEQLDARPAKISKLLKGRVNSERTHGNWQLQ
jgi:hypothetical protein